MQRAFWRNTSRFWPVLVLLCVELVIAILNYHPGTYLMGWDNVMPEFNFRQAFTTNIFGAWQEHRGLGLPDGMGHAANLVHTVFLWLLSFVAPQNTLRYIFQFLMHFTGMVGMLTLLKGLKSLRSEEKNNNYALVGALFYGLNLVTIQMFFTPLEAFSVHYAALPWLAYSLLRYFQMPSRKTLGAFALITFLSTPQFFIPTLILPTAILLGALSLGKNIRTVLRAALIFFFVNAFWILPYAINLPSTAPVIWSAKINQMSSDEVYERNRAFGDLKNVLSFKGFMFDFEDMDAQGQPVFVMAAWKDWIGQPFIPPILFFFGFLMVFGAITAKGRIPMAFVIIWLVALGFLANNTPGVSDVLRLIRDNFPMFAEAYRFPFTKFSILFTFSGTILLVNGLSFERRPLLKLIFVALLMTVSFPVFQGNFFYNALRVNLPKNYIQLFTFMKQQDHSGRTAYLPSPSYWSWKHYDFGYVGSGFLWYGLPQPLMDRAFDPWSQYNEQYYWDLSHALYTKDAQKLERVFETYDIRYVILDEHLRAPGHNRSLFTEEIKAMLAKKIVVFGELSVYERQTATQSFIRSLDRLPAEPMTTSYGVSKSEPVFRASTDSALNPESVKPCGVLKSGTAYGERIGPDTIGVNNALRIRSHNQRACLSFGDPTLPHTTTYRVEVITKNLSGRPLLFAVINDTAKHVELESYLTGNDTFYLPPLASDGLGYTMYFSGDAFTDETVNDIISVEIFEIEYHEGQSPETPSSLPVTVTRHNPAMYTATVPSAANALLLSQAYNPNWLAFVSGKRLMNHAMVNTWANGWILPQHERPEQTIFVIYWPQIAQWVGFGGILLAAVYVFSVSYENRG